MTQPLNLKLRLDSCRARLQAGTTRSRIFRPEHARYQTVAGQVYFFSAISMEARVISQSNFIVQLVPA
jgi:hypothetical protein